MDKYEKAKELATKLVLKEHLTEEEYRLLFEVLQEAIEAEEAEERRKELH